MNLTRGLMTPTEIKKSLVKKTFFQAREKDYTVVLDPDVFPGEIENAKARAVLKYVELLGVQTKIDVSHWKTYDFLFNENGEIDFDKKRVNRAFFSAMEDAPKAVKSPGRIYITQTGAKRFSHGILNVLKSVMDPEGVERVFRRRIADEKINLKSIEKKLRIEELKLKDFHEYRKMVQEGPPFNIERALEEIVKDGFYTIPRQNPDLGMSFITEPITLTHLNKKQGRNYVTRFGRYEVYVYPHEDYSATSSGFFFDAEVWPWEDNPIASDHWHPHISNGDYPGSICFGDVLPESERLRKIGDFVNFMSLIKSILTSYNDGNPYIEIDCFQTNLDADRVSAKGWMPGQNEWRHPDADWRPLRSGYNRRRPRDGGRGDELRGRGEGLGASALNWATVGVGTAVHEGSDPMETRTLVREWLNPPNWYVSPSDAGATYTISMPSPEAGQAPGSVTFSPNVIIDELSGMIPNTLDDVALQTMRILNRPPSAETREHEEEIQTPQEETVRNDLGNAGRGVSGSNQQEQQEGEEFEHDAESDEGYF